MSQEEREPAWRSQAEYLATINLSAGPRMELPLKTLPRPKGKATESDLHGVRFAGANQTAARRASSTRRAWRGMPVSVSRFSRRLDPVTGKVDEYPIPLLKPAAPTGILGVRFDKDENIWMGMQFQGGIAKFDRKTEKFQTWSLPPE